MPRYCFDALLAVLMTTALPSSPAFAQVIADPPVGSSEASENMPKATDTIPERVRTYDPEMTGGIKVRSDLADKPHKPAPRPKPH
jgi:hypothetical protein